jgi:hypothetical protein
MIGVLLAAPVDPLGAVVVVLLDGDDVEFPQEATTKEVTTTPMAAADARSRRCISSPSRQWNERPVRATLDAQSNSIYNI